jgi:hypothetical protein
MQALLVANMHVWVQALCFLHLLQLVS